MIGAGNLCWGQDAKAVILVVLAFFWVGCEKKKRSSGSAVQQQGKEISTTRSCSGSPPKYEAKLELKSLEGHYRIMINGFPVEQLPFMGTAADQNVTADLNTALVGKGNELTVEMMPFLTRGETDLNIGTVEVRARVLCNDTALAGIEIAGAQVDSAYRAWRKRTREQWKEYVEWEKQWLKQNPDSSETITARDGGALDSMRAWASENPLTVSTTFDNEAGPDFSRIFEEAPKLEDTPATRKRLKEYAMHLRDLLRSGEAKAIYQEIQPSVSEETGWFKVTRSGRRDSALAQIREEWLRDFRTDFSRSAVTLRRWSGGRVWELSVMRPEEGRRPFFSEGPHSSYLKVYVAEIDGKLRVVRLTA